ncbi:hypothetical protein GCM10027431_03930 [Lysobacter rhizosphaerae]
MKQDKTMGRVLGRVLTRELTDAENSSVSGGIASEAAQMDSQLPTNHFKDGGRGDTWSGSSWDDFSACDLVG